MEKDQDRRNKEPIEIRNQTKTQLYDLLKSKYILPDRESRGVSRQYLVAVYEGLVMRVERGVLLSFEANLDLSHLVKAGPVSISTVLRKLDTLQYQISARPLGFPDSGLPDEEWLWRIARYLDTNNILGLFRKKFMAVHCPTFSCHVCKLFNH